MVIKVVSIKIICFLVSFMKFHPEFFFDYLKGWDDFLFPDQRMNGWIRGKGNVGKNNMEKNSVCNKT